MKFGIEKSRRVFAWSVLFVSAAGVSLADRVEYIDGRIVHGIITRNEEDSVTIQNGDAEFKIPRSVIRQVVEGTPADHWLLKAKDELARGRTADGVIFLGNAAREGVQPESLAAVMLFHERDLVAGIPSLMSEGKASLAAALEHIRLAELPRQGELAVARYRLHLAAGDTRGSRIVLDELITSHMKTLDQFRAELSGLLQSMIDVSMRAERFSETIDLIEQLRRLDQFSAGGKRIELVLLWARRERDRGDYRRALDIYRDQLMVDSPEIATDRIMTTLEEAEKDFRNRNQVVRAIELYQTYGVPVSEPATREKMVELWREVGKNRLMFNELPEARQAFLMAEKIKPGSAGRDLVYCDYYEKKSALEPGDFVARFELGEWCLDQGLTEEAREAFVIASDSEILREHAFAQIDRIDNHHAETELSRLLDLYQRGRYFEVTDGLNRLRQKPLGEGYEEQAKKLEDLTRDAIALSAAARPQQAEVLLQQAERAYFTGKLSESYHLLRTLSERYSDTPAAARGERFMRMVGPQMDLDRIERGVDWEPAERAASDKTQNPDSAIAREIRRLRGEVPPHE